MIAKTPGSSRKKKTDDAYAVEYVGIGDIKPSPENDDIYGAVVDDTQMELLVSSIRNRGLEEPIILSADNFFQIATGQLTLQPPLQIQPDGAKGSIALP